MEKLHSLLIRNDHTCENKNNENPSNHPVYSITVNDIKINYIFPRINFLFKFISSPSIAINDVMKIAESFHSI